MAWHVIVWKHLLSDVTNWKCYYSFAIVMDDNRKISLYNEVYAIYNFSNFPTWIRSDFQIWVINIPWSTKTKTWNTVESS